MTALHKAVTQGFENVVHELLNLGADSNRPLPVRTPPSVLVNCCPVSCMQPNLTPQSRSHVNC